jgi:C4-dicarboxylate-specific signal transduction histidine kinase
MEFSLNIISFILLAFAVNFFIMALRQRKLMKEEVHQKDEAIKLKETEFNELRLIAASVTHEINNALTILMGRASQMLKKNHDPDQEKIIINMLKTSERIAASVIGLRQVIYPDKFEMEEVIELNVLMDNVFKLTGQRLRNHGVELKLKGIEHKIIKGRRSQLEQLIINLLNQSIERMNDLQEKWIQIVAVEEQDRLNIYFMDASGEVGDKIEHKQYSDILEENHGHLTVNQNNLVLELPQDAKIRYHT